MITLTPNKGFPHAAGDEVYGGASTKKPAPPGAVNRVKYRTVRDILIPAGTMVSVEPPGLNRRYMTPHASILIAETKDHTSEWAMDLGESIELGIVEPVPEDKADVA